jgi:hypothetical protein
VDARASKGIELIVELHKQLSLSRFYLHLLVFPCASDYHDIVVDSHENAYGLEELEDGLEGDLLNHLTHIRVLRGSEEKRMGNQVRSSGCCSL